MERGRTFLRAIFECPRHQRLIDDSYPGVLGEDGTSRYLTIAILKQPAGEVQSPILAFRISACPAEMELTSTQPIRLVLDLE